MHPKSRSSLHALLYYSVYKLCDAGYHLVAEASYFVLVGCQRITITVPLGHAGFFAEDLFSPTAKCGVGHCLHCFYLECVNVSPLIFRQ